MSFSTAGDKVVFGGENTDAYVRNIETGDLEHTFTEPTEIIHGTSYSENDEYVALAAGDTAYIYDTGTGDLVDTITVTGTYDIQDLEFDKNNQYLMFAVDSTLYFYAQGGWTEEATTTLNDNALGEMDVSSDNNFVAVGHSNGADIVSISSKTVEEFLSTPHGSNGVAFSKDGKYFAATNDDSTESYTVVWDRENNYEQITTLSDHSATPFDVDFSYNNEWIATSGSDSDVNIYSIEEETTDTWDSLIDGFENGDYLNDPFWQLEKGSAEVQQQNVFEGDHALNLKGVDGDHGIINYDMVEEENRTFNPAEPDKWTFTVSKRDDFGTDFGARYVLSDTAEPSFTSPGSIQVIVGFSNDFEVRTYGEDGTLASEEFGNAEFNEFYTFELYFDESDNTIDIEVLDAEGNVIATESNVDYTGKTDYENVVLMSSSQTTGDVLSVWDNVQYSYESGATVNIELKSPFDEDKFTLGNDPVFTADFTPEDLDLEAAEINLIDPDGFKSVLGETGDPLAFDGETVTVSEEFGGFDKTGTWEWYATGVDTEGNTYPSTETRTLTVEEDQLDITIFEPEGAYEEEVLSEGLSYDVNLDPVFEEENDFTDVDVALILEFPDGEGAFVDTYSGQDISNGANFTGDFTPNQLLTDSAELGDYEFEVEVTDADGLIDREFQTFTVEGADFDVDFNLFEPEDESEVETRPGENTAVEFGATVEATTDVVYDMRLNLESETIVLDNQSASPGETVTLEGETELYKGTYFWEVTAEDTDGTTVSSGENTFNVVERSSFESLISRIGGYAKTLDQAIRNSLDEGGQFMFATIVIFLGAMFLHQSINSDALAMLAVVLGAFAFSITPGYYDMAVGLIIAALAAGITMWFTVRGVSGG